MFELPIKNVMERDKFLTASPEATVRDAAKLMQGRNAGAVIVVDNGKLVGIFTERDVVFRVIAQGVNPDVTPLSAVMTRDPMTLEPHRTYGHALLLMQEHSFRHVPVVEGGKPIGIVSSRNAMDPELEEFASEARRREHYR